MSFLSDAFKVKDVERFINFCKAVGVEYELLGENKVVIFSNDAVEPPCTFVHKGVEHALDFDVELHKLLAFNENVTYRVEYEVGIHPNGEVEYWCDPISGAPEQGESNAEADAYPRPVF